MDFDGCFECGEPGHLARDCPARLAATPPAREPKPAWCGQCDQETRLVEGIRHGRDIVWRCVRCHPLRFSVLRQHKRCAGCKQVIYGYDHSPCGQHAVPAL
jgi:Zinc knuckle